MFETAVIAWSVFTAVTVAILSAIALAGRGDRQAAQRLREVGGPSRSSTLTKDGLTSKTLTWLPSLGSLLAPKDAKRQATWKARLARAGLHSPRALSAVMAARAAVVLLGPVIFVLAWAGGLPAVVAVIAGAVISGLSLILPGVWVDWRAARRLTRLRRGLPDALDMLVMCVEGGLSFGAALPRVRAELRTAHRELAAELSVAEREMMMGLSAGEALRKAGARLNLEELRSLASVLLQSQRYGAGTAKPMRTFADALRVERQHRIEERAQKASVKILFPTLLCIFPAIFVVVLGPAAYQIQYIFSHMQK
jgi:tight adherence protein C